MIRALTPGDIIAENIYRLGTNGPTVNALFQCMETIEQTLYMFEQKSIQTPNMFQQIHTHVCEMIGTHEDVIHSQPRRHLRRWTTFL